MSLHRQPARLQRGFSLVELMVALTLSLLLLAGALSILQSSRMSYAENERLSRLQEAGRTVMELVLRDVRGSGFTGCARAIQADDFANDIAGGAASMLWNFAQPANGYEVGGAAPVLDADLADVTPLTNSDILVLRTARQGQPTFRTTAEILGASTDPIQVARGDSATIEAGTAMVIADCRGASAFIATDFDGTAGAAEISFAGQGAGGSLTRGFDIGASVTPVQTVVYFVGTSTSGNGPALWQKVGADAPVELVEGVENLQFLYGLDSNADRIPNSYVAASAVGATNWNNVVAIQMAVLVRSDTQYGPEVDGRTYTMLGTSVGPFNDRRLRSLYTTTIVLRNRAN